MFWLKRLKEEDSQTSWMLSYGDLMSLLLAVFVMIAAMSELRAGKRFKTVSDAVRSAFGFSGVIGDWEPAMPAGRRPLSLIERLEQAGLRASTTVQAGSEQDIEVPCEVVTERDRVVVRLAGAVAFDRFSARLKAPAGRVIARMAEYLQGGSARLEIRGHNGDGILPSSAPFRDGLDLSYERARTVAEALSNAGVSRDRIYITAWGDSDPLVTYNPDMISKGVNRRIEIIVHAVPSTACTQVIAEKEWGPDD